MMLLQWIILSIYQKLQFERSPSAIYHLLVGKQSIQTIQDVQLFQLTDYFGIYKSLSKHTFDTIISYCQEINYLSKDEQTGQIVLTKLGEKYVASEREDYYFNGIGFHKVADEFFSRLLLMIQVWTNSCYNHFKFIPVVDNLAVEKWVKAKYVTTKSNPAYYLELLYEDLSQILSSLPSLQASIFVEQLSGYEYIGKTREQLATNYELDRIDVDLLTISTLHTLLEKAKDKEKYPLLNELTKGLFKSSRLTKSAAFTQELLVSGNHLAEIAEIRKLKINTVYDHIVEIAVFDPLFDIRDFVREEAIMEVFAAVKKLNSFKLSLIKAHISEDIDYFQIRLSLARLESR